MSCNNYLVDSTVSPRELGTEVTSIFESADDVISLDSEPADPEDPDHSARRNTPLIPSSVPLDTLPEPLTEDENGNRRRPAVSEARTTYMKIHRHLWNKDGRTSGYERHRYEVYPRLLEADRRFRYEYQGLTTVLLTRRLSPLDDCGDWLTPWECDQMLHEGTEGKIQESIRRALSYHLDQFEFEWVGVTAPTETAGTPHEHIYLWIEDPANQVEVGDITPALEKHVKRCENAESEDHPWDSNADEGAIIIHHSPPLVESPPEKFFDIKEESQVYADAGIVLPNTAGAQYLASQLAHLPLGDYYNQSKDDPSPPLLAGGALAWASPHHWFRPSSGFPT